MESEGGPWHLSFDKEKRKVRGGEGRKGQGVEEENTTPPNKKNHLGCLIDSHSSILPSVGKTDARYPVN